MKKKKGLIIVISVIAALVILLIVAAVPVSIGIVMLVKKAEDKKTNDSIEYSKVPYVDDYKNNTDTIDPVGLDSNKTGAGASDAYKEKSSVYMIGFDSELDQLLEYGPSAEINIRYDKKAEVTYVYYYFGIRQETGPIYYDLTDEQFENISKLFDYDKLYYLDPEEANMEETCDGGFLYLYLFGADGEISKTVGGFCPHNKYFCDMMRACYENVPDEIFDQIQSNMNLENGVLEKVPDYISDRGVIIPGVMVEDTGTWWQQYKTDCNIFVVSSNDEFVEFVESLGGSCEFLDPMGPEDNPEYKRAVVKEDDAEGKALASYEIYRTCFYPFDKSSGWLKVEDELTYMYMLSYDPTGKYIIVDESWSNSPMWIDFLEPEMKEVSVSKNASGKAEIDSTESEDIKAYIDAFHALNANIDDVVKTKKIEDAEERYTVTFTDENGHVNEYEFGVFHGNIYYFIEDQVYKLENADDLMALLKTLP